jgi:hypothetical protein
MMDIKVLICLFFTYCVVSCNQSQLSNSEAHDGLICHNEIKNYSAFCLESESLNIIHEEYKKRINENTIMDTRGGFSPNYYPAEVIASVYSIGVQKNDRKLIDWANNEIELLTQKTSEYGYLVWPDKLNGELAFGSNSQARLVLSLALLYEHTKDKKISNLLHKTFTALDSLPKILVSNSINGNLHKLPFYAYTNLEFPTGIGSRTLDPNQDASLALAYALYSKFSPNHIKASVIDQANKYLTAAFDTSVIGKCTPLADHPDYLDLCDTRYNSWWLAQVYEATKILGRLSEFENQLKSEYEIIRPWLLSSQTNRQYPSYYTGSYPDPIEPMLLANVIFGFDEKINYDSYIYNINNMIRQADDSTIKKWPSGWLYPSYFLNRN